MSKRLNGGRLCHVKTSLTVKRTATRRGKWVLLALPGAAQRVDASASVQPHWCDT